MLNPNLNACQNVVIHVATMHDEPKNFNNHIESPESNGEDLYVFFIRMNSFSRHIQLIICATFAISFYLLSGISQEYLFVHYQGFDFGFFLTLFQFLVHSVLSAIQQRQDINMSRQLFSSNIIRWYLLLAALMVSGVGLGNQSLAYLNYPTKILFKSSKLLFAMIAGICVTHRRYNLMDYIASILIVLGLISLFDANRSGDMFNATVELKGIVLITTALFSDAFSSNIQEKILKDHGRATTELIFWAHAIGSIMLLMICIVTDQLVPALKFCQERPHLILVMIAYSTLSYMGVQFVHTMTKLFGILVTLTVTSSRKVASVMLSYIIFPKPLTFYHSLAICFIFGGIFMRIYNKNKSLIDSHVAYLYLKYLRRKSAIV